MHRCVKHFCLSLPFFLFLYPPSLAKVRSSIKPNIQERSWREAQSIDVQLARPEKTRVTAEVTLENRRLG